MKRNLYLTAAAAFAAQWLIFGSLACAQDSTAAGRGGGRGEEETLRRSRHPMKFNPTGPYFSG